MTELLTQNPTAISVCALRLARLAADGTTPASPVGGYCNKALAKLSIKTEVEVGTEVLARNACGDLDVNFKARDILKRYTLGLEVLGYDPELDEMLLSVPLLTSSLGTTRTVTDGATTNGSTTVSSATAAFTAFDVGSTIAATGIPALATIAAILSPTQVTISAPATATGATLSTVITAVAISVGTEGYRLGVQPTDNGLSLEAWCRNIRAGVVDQVFPWLRIVFPATFWSQGDPVDLEANVAQRTVYAGFGTENAGWGNGPWNDWMKVRSTDTAQLLSSGRAYDKHFLNWIPATQVGYVAVPTQV